MAKKKITSATDQRPFIILYQDFLESDLFDNHYQKLVYIYLKKFADSKNQCFPSVKTLANLTKISIKKVQLTLIELEEKGVIRKENRTRLDGGKSSNLYTLYDFKELWDGSNKDIATITEEISEMKLIAELRARGYKITKEKEIVSEPTKVQKQSLKKQNDFSTHDNTLNSEKSQDTEYYSLELVHILYDYDTMLHDYSHDKGNIDSVINILKDSLNTALPTIRIGQEDKPTMVVVSKLLKLNHSEIMYVIQKYKEQKERIKNPHNYILTMLYRAKEQMNLDITNQVQHDMYNWTPETEFDYE